MKCQYKDKWGRSYVCPEEALPDSKEHFCIFHERRKDKDVGEFNKKIEEKIAQKDFNFTGYFFPDGVPFGNLEFTKEAYFRNATFTKEAYFRNATFTKEAYFKGATFTEKANFIDATFTKEANFIDATFTKEAYFKGATFTKEADFFGATFTKEADFFGATFTKEAVFLGITFTKEAYFGSATFTKKAYFRNATFTKKADFGIATFTKKAAFCGSTFTKEANFKGATFSGITYFRNVHFKKEVSFEYTFFSDITQIRLDPKYNLGKASFAGSNCDRVDFSGSKWNADNKEEIIIFEESKGVTGYQTLEEIYRRLKQSHQRFGDHDRAGKFYYREMESRRKHQKETKQRLNCLWSEIFRITCGYGERPRYTIFLMGIIVLLWALFYFFGGIVHITNGTEIIINYDLATKLTPEPAQLFYDFLWALYTSIITFTSLGYGDLHPIGWSRVAASIEVFIGVFMIALFLFVFTRKMVR